MSQIFDSLKALISPEMISKASAFLGENDSKVSTAASSIMPGLLGSLLKKGDTPQVKNTLEEAGRTNLLSNIGSIFSGNMTGEQEGIGNRFLNALLGSKTTEFTSAVASHAGISGSSANKLATIISAVTAGFLGNKLVNNNMTMSSLLGDLNKEKSSFMGWLPAGLSSTLGLNAAGKTYVNEPKKKKGMGWLTWLLLILALLIIFFWWRSCRNTDRSTRITTADTVRNRTAVVDTNTVRTVGRDTVVRRTTEVALPDNSRISGFEDGTEDRLVRFLRSDDYRNATGNYLRTRWFSFDNIEFEFGTTELEAGATSQLNNIASIMKNYPDTKIMIGGFADKRGGQEVNQELSERRAETIKAILVRSGINANRIQTQGFGEEYAKHPETSSDDQRAEDRTVAIRFVK